MDRFESFNIIHWNKGPRKVSMYYHHTQVLSLVDSHGPVTHFSSSFWNSIRRTHSKRRHESLHVIISYFTLVLELTLAPSLPKTSVLPLKPPLVPPTHFFQISAQLHIQIGASQQEGVRLHRDQLLDLVVISCIFQSYVCISRDSLSCPCLLLTSRVIFHIAHASKVLSTPVTTVNTPMMRFIFESVDRLRGKRAAKV